MGVEQPELAGKRFDALFRDGDLEGLMELYEEDAVFTNAAGAHVGLAAIREVLKGYLDSGAELSMNESIVFKVSEIALVHWSWTMKFPDGRMAEGATAEVLREQPDSTWKFVIDNPDGSALINHD